ncbi:SMP-30/gluconolactonase/LRE family protein [bacterium]|nr:SMP-30/gluconolactonase/LRE family protein [bacterium]
MLNPFSPSIKIREYLQTVSVLAVTAIFTLAAPLNAQNHFVNPESAVYDAVGVRTLVSNTGNGNIVAVDLEENQTLFNTELSSVRGVTIAGGWLWVAATEGVAGFNLATGILEELVVIDGAIFLNDITTDGVENLYVTDSNAARIYRISLQDLSYTQFVDNGLASSNGLYYDGQNERLLVVSYRANSPVQAVSLADSSVSTVINTTLDNLDGITADNQGRFYVSSWSTNSTYRFAADFSGDPALFSSGHADPADIGFDAEHSLLLVPNFNGNSVDFLVVEDESVTEQPDRSRTGFSLSANYPNPFNGSTVIPYTLSRGGVVLLELYQINGELVDTLLDEFRLAGQHKYRFAPTALASGSYIYQMRVGSVLQSGRMVYLK